MLNEETLKNFFGNKEEDRLRNLGTDDIEAIAAVVKASDITPSQKSSVVYVECGGKIEIWKTRAKAMKFYLEGMICCDGSERDRYADIYCQLTDKRCKFASDDC